MKLLTFISWGKTNNVTRYKDMERLAVFTPSLLMRAYLIYSTSTPNNQRTSPEVNLGCLISTSTVSCAVIIWLFTAFVGHPRRVRSATDITGSCYALYPCYTSPLYVLYKCDPNYLLHSLPWDDVLVYPAFPFK